MKPNHWTYTLSHIEQLNASAGISQSRRWWATMIKMRQQHTNGRYGMEDNGLDLETATPYIIWSSRRGGFRNLRTDIGQDRYIELVEAWLLDFVADARLETAQDYDNAHPGSAVQLSNAPDSELTNPCDQACWASNARKFQGNRWQGQDTFRVIPQFRDAGVSEAVLEELIQWCEYMWPNGQWDEARP